MCRVPCCLRLRFVLGDRFQKYRNLLKSSRPSNASLFTGITLTPKRSSAKPLVPFPDPPSRSSWTGGASLDVVKALPAVGRVLLRDGFNRCARNADYPNRSNFDDLLYTYRSRGFDGFSDFSIVGDVYSPGGGAAKHVAIHLTELEKTTIVANHFVSGTPPQKGNNQAKYFSALRLLVSHTGTPPSADLDTQGVCEYHQSNSPKHYPGLGKLKQWSIMHHMEIIDRKIAATGISSFV